MADQDDNRAPRLVSIPFRNLDFAQIALTRARGIIDILQGAAAHGALEPPSNEESLAATLGAVLQLLDEAEGLISPDRLQGAAEQPQ